MWLRIVEHLSRFLRVLTISLLVFCLLSHLMGTVECFSAEGRQATLLEFKGAIGPAISDYLVNGLQKSVELQAAIVILRMDTPGGLDHSMREIIRAVLASPIPVITYVAPDGARAASAGTYILYASHIAAMAPATNLGAATPIAIGGLLPEPDTSEKNKGKEPGEKSGPAGTLERKMVNDAAAYIRALADRHGRNGDWAVKAVKQAVSLSATEALEIGVVDVIASDLSNLLKQADGREVRMESSLQVVSTKDLTIVPIEQTWRTRILAVVSNPNIAYMLFLLGIYGLIFEFANPGFVLPGVAGGIALLLAMYAFQVLPVNYSGLALIILGILFLIGEAFAPSFGTLGIGGIISFVVGSIILMDVEEFRVALPNIVGTSLVTAAFLLWLMGRLVTLRHKRVETGAEALVGMIGEAIDDFENEGRIWLLGESWKVTCPGRMKRGEKVRITDQDGLCLTVEKYQEEK